MIMEGRKREKELLYGEEEQFEVKFSQLDEVGKGIEIELEKF